MKQKKFICSVCGYVHIGDKAPDECPQCHQRGVFVEQKSKGLDTNSNLYTIIYATVMVVIVALLLAVVSSALKPKQQANVELDRKKQVLSSLNIELKGQNAEELYSKLIDEQDINGQQLFVATLEDGSKKYIIPMRGAGLWGAIWGYIALDDDMNTIYGTFFNHDSETPGLGGEIATRAFQTRFNGKHIKAAEALNVDYNIEIVKGEATGEQVQAISGATITSKGVEDMINAALAEYTNILKGGTNTEDQAVEDATEVAENNEPVNEEVQQ